MRAERDWHLPAGLLAAIGMVESGRHATAGVFPIIWPWTLNAEGRGFYQPSKAAAVGMVRALQLRGVRVIDVGCFQVDLFYHPTAFASLEEAFDPDANARAAVRILSLGRLGSTDGTERSPPIIRLGPCLGPSTYRRFVPSCPGSQRIRAETNRILPRSTGRCCPRRRIW